MRQKDYYRILGIEKDATHQQVKETYRRLAFEFHPDRNKGDLNAVEKMKELNEAYAVLSDPEKRNRYDSMNQQYGYDGYDHFRNGYSEQDIFRGSDINQIFEEMTRQFGFRNFNDLFREFYGPGYKTFEFKHSGIFGKGFIFTGFPFGRHGNQQNTFSSSKTAFVSGLLAKLAGYMVRKAFKGRYTSQQTADRYGIITISREQASRGGKVSYIDPTTSRQLVVTVPVGVREGQTIRLKGAAGFYGDRSQADLYLRVQFRKSLLESVKKLYNKFLSK